MNTINFVFIDGPDGIGKSTLCNNLCDIRYETENPWINSKMVNIAREQLPSGNGSLGFLRGLVKNRNFKCDDFARQLLHCCSHIKSFLTNAYEEYLDSRICGFSRYNYIFFDRGPLSTLVYGDSILRKKYPEDIASEYLDILGNINLEVLEELVRFEYIDQIYYINLIRDKPYRLDKDESYYEEVTEYKELSEKYKDMAEALYARYDLLELRKAGKIVNINLNFLEEKGIISSTNISDYIWKNILLKAQ